MKARLPLSKRRIRALIEVAEACGTEYADRTYDPDTTHFRRDLEGAIRALKDKLEVRPKNSRRQTDWDSY